MDLVDNAHEELATEMDDAAVHDEDGESVGASGRLLLLRVVHDNLLSIISPLEVLSLYISNPSRFLCLHPSPCPSGLLSFPTHTLLFGRDHVSS